MKNLTKSLILMVLAASCNMGSDENETKDNNTDTPEHKEIAMNDTTPKITGIGGIFFRAKNPQEMNSWYGKNLGMATDDYGNPSTAFLLIWVAPPLSKIYYFSCIYLKLYI